jgi:hypothetical protein
MSTLSFTKSQPAVVQNTPSEHKRHHRLFFHPLHLSFPHSISSHTTQSLKPIYTKPCPANRMRPIVSLKESLCFYHPTFIGQFYPAAPLATDGKSNFTCQSLGFCSPSLFFWESSRQMTLGLS